MKDKVNEDGINEDRINRDKLFPRIMFAASGSGSGKTLITCAFLEILKRRGIEAVSFKCGPDYIDPLFHSFVTGIPAINLDTFFLGRDEVVRLFKRKVRESCDKECRCGGKPIAVIEGVMGYCDGLAGTSLTASSYDIADALNCPVILIMDMRSEDISPEEELKELTYRMPESHIRGVILNRALPEEAAGIYKEIESLGLQAFGYIPECDEARMDSRHLGLKLPAGDQKFQEKISSFSDIIEKTTDIDGIIRLAREAGYIPPALSTETRADAVSAAPAANGSDMCRGTIAVARDEAFCFIYEDNIDFLKELGFEIVYFSPLRDKALPSGASAVLLPGGYPEVCAKGLSENTEMLKAIREACGNIKIMAECGGFLYLHESLEGIDGKVYPMAGCIRAEAYRAGRSPRFGYISLYPGRKSGMADSPAADDCLIKAHEFHYWDSTDPGSDLRAVKPISLKSWHCCMQTPSLLAGFPHLYYRSGASFIRSFLEGDAL